MTMVRCNIRLCVLYLNLYAYCFFFFFFKQKTAYEVRISDWSSDVCSSDLGKADPRQRLLDAGRGRAACRCGRAPFNGARPSDTDREAAIALNRQATI